MLTIIGTLLVGLAVISVSFELTWPAAAFGALGMWLVAHGA